MSVNTTNSGAVPDVQRRTLLSRRIRWFVAATITYNVIEAVVAITAGTIASSTALVAFGLDSVIEVSSAAAVAWQFAGKDPEARERTALRVIAVSFFALAAYVTTDSVLALTGGHDALPSPAGLILASLSLIVMPFLSYGQRRTGRELNSRSAVADSKQTLLCTYLSAVLLIGLTLNSLFGWSWADPIAALVIAVAAVNEGREAWMGDSCCTPAAAVPAGDVDNGVMDVELRVIENCPNDGPATSLLRQLLDEAGAAATPIRRTVVNNPRQAADLEFTGSPTFVINGVDPFDDPLHQVGLTCRVYPTATGHAGIPAPSDLRSAITARLG